MLALNGISAKPARQKENWSQSLRRLSIRSIAISLHSGTVVRSDEIVGNAQLYGTVSAR
jgi:hypothetical protein